MNEVEIQMENKNIKSFERAKYNVDSLIVSNLKYTVVKKEGKNPFNRKEVSKTILDGINLDIKLGQLNAILGPSGSGKTTLLNFMAMRVQENSKPFGVYQVNGIDAYQNKNYRKSVSYIMQDEILLAHLTVKETLTYAARLKLPKQMSEKEKAIHVDELLKKLNLKHCENTIVGQPGVIKGISGGERKRLSIGMELISNPSILFVDEPTSGLDSVMSFEVIELLKYLTQNEGVTVITTIHQPSSDIFKLFDNVILLKNGKILSYCGTLELIELFNKYDLRMEKFTNPADHFLTVLFDRENLYSEKFENIIEHYHETQGKQVKEKLGENVDDKSEINTGNSLFKKDKKNQQDQSSVYKNSKPSFFYTYRVLTYRAFLSNFRDPQGYFYVVGTTIMMSLIIGLIFLRIGKNNQRSIQDRQGAILFVLVNLGFTGIQQVISTFGPQRAVFLKEYLGGMYGTVPYFFSVISAELVVQALNPLIFISISYFLIGFVPRVDNFFIFFIVITLICLTMNGGGYFIAAAAKDIATALQLVSIIMLPLILMGGFFINASSIPKYLIWVQYISPFKYGYELLMIQEFSSLTFVCKPSELVNGICPRTTGQQVLANYFSFKIYKALNWSLLVVLMVAFNTVALFTLIWRARTYKRKGTI